MYAVKQTGNRPTAFQASPFMRWKISYADAWVDCMSCSRSIGVDSSRTIIDEKFLELARNHGWIVEPGEKILCPECAKKASDYLAQQ